MKHKDLKITYEHGNPYGIRDKTGFLLTFRVAKKFEGQEERYRKDLQDMFDLADYLLKALKDRKLEERK